MTATRATGSQSNPCSSRGDIVMTSTPTADRNVAAPIGAEAARGAGTGHARAGHEETLAGSTAGAGRAADAGRAQRLVWLDPRTFAVHPRNVRDDLGDLTGLAASIAAQGVLEALTVVPATAEDTGDGAPGYQLVAGHRRAAAAILAGRDTVPCVLRGDLALDPAAADGDRAGQAGHVAAMLAENLHRQGLSAVEEAHGVQAMLDLGVFLASVAKSTGLGRKRVAKAAGVARLDGDTATKVSAAGLTLDQAAAVAVYADHPDTAAELIEAAAEGQGRFAHALTRAKQAKEEAQQVAALSAELAVAGRTVLDEADGERATRISALAHDGAPLTADDHAACPGAAACVATGWNGPQVVEVCTDPQAFGHTSRWPDSQPAGSSGGGEPTEADREAAAAERREVLEKNKAMAAANQTRRDWVKALLQRCTAPNTALRFAVETLVADPHPVSRWLSGQSNSAQDSAAADLGLAAPGGWWAAPDRPAPTLTSGEPLPDGRSAVALLAHVAAPCEAGIDRSSWRDPSASAARWLRFSPGPATPSPTSSSRSSTPPRPGPPATGPTRLTAPAQVPTVRPPNSAATGEPPPSAVGASHRRHSRGGGRPLLADRTDILARTARRAGSRENDSDLRAPGRRPRPARPGERAAARRGRRLRRGGRGPAAGQLRALAAAAAGRRSDQPRPRPRRRGPVGADRLARPAGGPGRWVPRRQ